MIRTNAPEFVKMLVAARVASEIDREDSAVEIKLGENLKLQLWFKEDCGYWGTLEIIDRGDPTYLHLFRCDIESEFREMLLQFAKTNSLSRLLAVLELVEVL